MKPDYFELMSPEPILISGVGNILSPTLRDISHIGIHTYHYYLSVLSMDLKMFFSMTDQPERYDLLSGEELSQLKVFDLLTAHTSSAALLQTALNFFLKEEVLFVPEKQYFLVTADENIPQEHPAGKITRENYENVCSIICHRNNVRFQNEYRLSDVKSKKAREIIKKLQKGRAGKNRSAKADKSMELGNVISAVANRHPSLNALNIWDITIFQLWDAFFRLSSNQIYDIEAMSVAAWGNKDSRFDAAGWFKPIE